MIETVLDISQKLGYLGIVLLMCLESSFFPVPSEIVMIPAGVVAARGGMDPWIAITCGVIGSWLGALLNYSLAIWLGRPVIYKYGKYVLLPQARMEKIEKFFNDHGEISTFTGRLIPVVRHAISFPAGLTRMNMFRFLLFTGLGAGLWVTILTWIGYVAGKQLDKITAEEIERIWHEYSTEVTLGLLAFCIVLIALYIIWHRSKNRHSSIAD